MLLHGEQWWLIGYMLAVVAAVVAAIVTGQAVWLVALIGIGGVIVAFYGWLLQVGRFG